MTFIQHTIELYFLGLAHHFANNNRDILYIYVWNKTIYFVACTHDKETFI